jgi:hypothetical protein
LKTARKTWNFSILGLRRESLIDWLYELSSVTYFCSNFLSCASYLPLMLFHDAVLDLLFWLWMYFPYFSDTVFFVLIYRMWLRKTLFSWLILMQLNFFWKQKRSLNSRYYILAPILRLLRWLLLAVATNCCLDLVETIFLLNFFLSWLSARNSYTRSTLKWCIYVDYPFEFPLDLGF